MHSTTPVTVAFPPLYKHPRKPSFPPHKKHLPTHTSHASLNLTDRREAGMAGRFATLAVAVLLAAAVVAPPAAVRGAVSCSTVYNSLMPCLSYVQNGGMVPQMCCGGIRSLLAQANNTPDRRAICGCLKNVASGTTGGTYIDRAAGLPGKCGVSLPYKISTSVNCNSIN